MHPKPSNFNYNLEALRGFAAIMVVFNHIIYHHQYFNTGFFPNGLLGIDTAAHFCVLIFFVLSGFVIGTSQKNRLTVQTVPTYLKKRFVRLYPIYFITICFTLLIAVNHYSITTITSNFTFTQNILSKPIFECNPIWSLNYEILYYLLFIPISYFNINPIAVFFGSVLLAILNFYFHFTPLISSYFFGFSFWMTGLIMAKYLKNAEPVKFARLIACFLFIWPLQNLLEYQGYINRILLHTIHKTFNYPVSTFDNYFKLMIPIDNLIYLLYCVPFVSLFSGKTLKHRNFILITLLLFPLALILKDMHSQLRYVQLFCYLIGLMLYFFEFKPIDKISKSIIKRFTTLGSISYGLYIIHFPLFYIFVNFNVSTPELYILKLFIYLLTIFCISYLVEIKLQPVFRRLLMRSPKIAKTEVLPYELIITAPETIKNINL
ncbi:MAG: acyltransferase [Mucilaginibacter sp.]|nr:acyltransferase [Mucilaginibacter sp.]